MANYRRELWMRADIRKKEKVEKATEFVQQIKKVQEEARAALKKTQEDIKRQVDKEKKKSEKWKNMEREVESKGG